MIDWAKMIGITPAEFTRKGMKDLWPSRIRPLPTTFRDLNGDLPGRHREGDHRRHHKDQRRAEEQDLDERDAARAEQLIRVHDRAGEALQNGEEDQEGHAVPDAPLRDLLAEPHDEYATGGETNHREEAEPQPRHQYRRGLRLEEERVRVGLPDTEDDRRIAGPLGQLPTTLFSLLLELLDRREHGREQLEENARGDVGHDAEGEDRGALQPATHEEIVDPEDRPLELPGQALERDDVHARCRDVRAKSIEGETHEGEEDLLPQLRNSEHVGGGGRARGLLSVGHQGYSIT